MKRYLGISFVAFCSMLLLTGIAMAKPIHHITSEETEVDVGPDFDVTAPVVSKVLQDTIWVADWSFDTGAPCSDAGWVRYDYRIRNNGVVYWSVNNVHAGGGGGIITNNAAVLSYHELCWFKRGSGDDWDQSIVLKYSGTGSTLSLDFIAHTQTNWDYIYIEADSLGLSEARVDYTLRPNLPPFRYRKRLATATWTGNFVAGVAVSALPLPDFGAGVHEVYIRFASNHTSSDFDGGTLTTINASLVVDDISVVSSGAISSYTEDFESTLNANVTFQNTGPATPFGQWARVYKHISDNDKCTENTTCAWLWTDPTRGAAQADMGFGPGGAIIRNWLDHTIVSPWVDLTTTLQAKGTILSMRRFNGNSFTQGKIAQNWAVRQKFRKDNTDTTTLGDSVECVSQWAHVFSWNSLTSYFWATYRWDMTGDMAGWPGVGQARELQMRFRLSDWQWVAGDVAPSPFNPGPGPYNDRFAIGRRIISGPVFAPGIDNRFQAQDCFPTALNASGPGQHYSPTTDRFGTCAFSWGTDLGINTPGSPIVLTGDSITMSVQDARGSGGIASVRFYGAIVEGPHAGKNPTAPYAVGGNGFFEITPDSMRNVSGVVIANAWFVDFDDTYFRGGDKMVYFWFATDAGAASASYPSGLTALPASVEAAQVATEGLREVTFLPTINWDPAYRARIVADAAGGDLDPDATELANSTQKNCMLYFQMATAARRDGPLQNTSFMRTLNALGYRGHYDIYDVSGYGNTNNVLGGRATPAQATGYALIVQDNGRGLTPNLPNGSSRDNEKVDQAGWYQSWLGAAATSIAQTATLWIIGEDVAYEKRTNALIQTTMGLGAVVDEQGLAVNPDVKGVANHLWADGSTGTFIGDHFALNGGCPVIRDYDGYTPGGSAVATHQYYLGATPSNNIHAIVMNSNGPLKWNTVAMGFGWFDIRDPVQTPPGTRAKTLASKVLAGALPLACRRTTNPTDNGGDPEVEAPRVTSLYQNIPNPFNPTTKIRFDLARSGHVKLQVFDVAGHVVATLVNQTLDAKHGHEVIWNGLDDANKRVSSGVYFYQLVTDELTATKKMVVLK